MFKKLISIILIAAISLTLPVCASAENSADNIPSVLSSEIIQNGGISKLVFYDKDGSEISFKDPGGEFSFDTASNITYPEKYDARDDGLITSVKNQTPFGACWAFAYCSAAETSLIKQGYETKDSVDLSEAHLARWAGDTRNHNYDSVYGIGVDSDELYTGKNNPFDLGGNSFIADATLARGSGFVKEEDFPYTEDRLEMLTSTEGSKYGCNYQLVSSVTSYDTSVDKVKKAILESGSVMASFCADYENCFKKSDNGYCYYCPEITDSNHMVTIVGWDDNFSARNFSYNPGDDGAWLVKNSWGEEWGDNGYFWLSYYDMSFDQTVQIKVVPGGSYDYIYQYDGIYCGDLVESNVSTNSMANIFTVKGEGESVSSASFNLIAPLWYAADVALYTDLRDPADPESGTLQETKSISCTEQGYYKINFSRTYPVEKESRFSVVVTLRSNMQRGCLPIEGNHYGQKKYYDYDSDSYFTISYHSAPNESFLKYGGEDEWHESVENNFPVKAFTINEKDVASVKIKTPPEKTQYYKGNTLSTDGLSLLVTLKNGEELIVTSGFSCDITKFDSVGEKTVTVTYSDKEVTFPVTVKEMPANAVKGFRADDVTVHYRRFTEIPVTVDSDGTAKYEISYCSCNEYKVFIDSEGTVYGVNGTKDEPVKVICTLTDEFGNVFTDECEVSVKLSFGQWLIVIFLFGWAWYFSI